MLCVSFEMMGFCGGNGGKLYSRRLTPCGRGLMAPPGLTALGAKGSVRDRLTPPGRVEGSALGRYIVPLRCEVRRLLIDRMRQFCIKPLQPGFRPPENHTTALRARKCIPPLVAGATTFPPLRGGTMDAEK